MIPLLSGKPLSEFTPEEYKAYVKSLYHKRVKKKSAPKKKRLRDYKVSVRSLKKGLKATTKREPKYLTKEELAKFAETFRENELFIALKAAEIHIYPDHETAEQIVRDNKENPW